MRPSSSSQFFSLELPELFDFGEGGAVWDTYIGQPSEGGTAVGIGTYSSQGITPDSSGLGGVLGMVSLPGQIMDVKYS